jgi:hemoglobin
MRCLLPAMLLTVAACAGTTTQGRTLYDDLGGEAGIRNIVTTTVRLAHADERISFLFEEMNDADLIAQLEDQICHLSGGPCTYEGRDMAEAHSGMDISEAEFDVFVDRFIDAMVEAGVSHPARNRLLALLAPMREDIIHQ